MRHILTVDLEDWFHVCGAEEDLPAHRWDELPSQLPRTTRRILDLLDAHRARATFFVLGYVAERYPDLVAEVAERGHEIGSHGFAHRRVYDLQPAQFAADLRASVRAIRNACGVSPTTFRAPEWSIRPSCDWAFEILARHGFEFDSSVVPLTWLGSRSFPPCSRCAAGRVPASTRRGWRGSVGRSWGSARGTTGGGEDEDEET